MKKILLLFLLTAGPLEAQNWENFHLGVDSLTTKDLEKAKEYFSKAALEWEAQSLDPSSRFNAGTAWALAGNYREAVKNLRAYLRDNPFSWEAKANLEKARNEGGLVDPGWDLNMKPAILWILLILGSLVLTFFFITWGMKALRGRRPSFSSMIPVYIITGIFALGLVVFIRWIPDVQILSTSVAPRKGDGEYYETVGDAWKTAQEVHVLETKSGWVKVKAGTREGWVPEDFLGEY